MIQFRWLLVDFLGKDSAPVEGIYHGKSLSKVLQYRLEKPLWGLDRVETELYTEWVTVPIYYESEINEDRKK